LILPLSYFANNRIYYTPLQAEKKEVSDFLCKILRSKDFGGALI
jgi:hypothetical protein